MKHRGSSIYSPVKSFLAHDEKVKQLVALSLIQDQSRRSMQPASFTFTFRLLPSRHTWSNSIVCPLSKDPILGYVSIY